MMFGGSFKLIKSEAVIVQICIPILAMVACGLSSFSVFGFFCFVISVEK